MQYLQQPHTLLKHQKIVPDSRKGPGRTIDRTTLRNYNNSFYQNE